MRKQNISKDWLFTSSEEAKIPVDLPHDYSIHIPRNIKAAGGASNGFFEGGRGTYVKYLPGVRDEHVILDIDGAYMCARVIFNENQLIMHPYGYTPFLLDLSERINREASNKIEITTENLQPSTRWYSGAGLYRDVFLWTGGKIRIEPWDAFITTISLNEKKATIRLSLDITSDLDGKSILHNYIISSDKKRKLLFCESLNLYEGKNKFNFEYEIEEPHTWSPESPELYTFEAEIIYNDEITDTYNQTFGIRTLSVNASTGLLLNGKEIKLQGGCIHHDHGALGAASFPAAEYRKLKKLKDAGFNAVRCAHNPPSSAFLEVCDRIGMIVMDEAFDMWNRAKRPFDYSLWFADWYERDIKSMVMRDRKHPSVISYSIGNEILERDGTSNAFYWAKTLVETIKKYDKTRPVTTGICGFWGKPDMEAPADYDNGKKGMADTLHWPEETEGFCASLDMVGYNYRYEKYENDHKIFPERVIWGSETHALNIYHSWKKVMESSYVIGDFTWTAYDNLGEAGTGRSLWKRDGEITGISLGSYPWRSCYQGDFDLCGYRRPQSYFRERVWKKDCKPAIFTTHPEHYGEEFSGTGWHWYDVSDTWTFDDKYIGRPVKTDVYTDADEVEFILNGKSFGKAPVKENTASMDIRYEKGTLKVITYKNGNAITDAVLNTVNKAEKITVIPDKMILRADNRDLCYLEIFITDCDGNRVPQADNKLRCECTGGELMCIYGANPANEDDYSDNSCHAFEGRALAVIRSRTPQIINLKISSDKLQSAEIKISSV